MPGGHEVEALIAAAASKGPSGLAGLLKPGQSLEQVRAGYGLTVLHALARPKSGTATDRRALRAILQHGIDVHARDDRGQTGLHRAAASGSWWMLAPLIEHGADLFDSANNGWDVVEFARNRIVKSAEGATAHKAMEMLQAMREQRRLEMSTPPVRASSLRTPRL